MKKDSITQQYIDSLDTKELGIIFNRIMDSYARRLCEMFEYWYEDSFWVGDDRFDCFALSDSGIFISADNVKTIVDNNIDYDTFIEWDDYNKGINYAQNNHPEDSEKYHYINLISWIKGCPRQFTKEELNKEEDLFWENMTNDIEETFN